MLTSITTQAVLNNKDGSSGFAVVWPSSGMVAVKPEDKSLKQPYNYK